MYAVVANLKCVIMYELRQQMFHTIIIIIIKVA